MTPQGLLQHSDSGELWPTHGVWSDIMTGAYQAAVFGFRATPPAGAGLDALCDALDWPAPGFEIVHAHLPGWKFVAPQTVAELRACPAATDIAPGDIVTTGTWTDAWPVQAGEVWRAEFDQALPALEVSFV
jgi:2-keto-4-pentenoate hydratase